MNIDKIEYRKGATITLSGSEMIIIANLMTEKVSKEPATVADETFFELRRDFYIANEIVRSGHIDSTAVSVADNMQKQYDKFRTI